jgi:hypothetical protein
VKAIVPLQDSTEFLVVSDNQICKLNNKSNKDCKNFRVPDLTVIRNTSEEPSYIVGADYGAKPSSATVLDINGQLKWKIESGFDAMGKNAVLDDGEERFVVWKIKSRTTLFKL